MSHTMNFVLLSKNILSPEEQELYELATLAGVVLDPSVYKIILDLLKMNVSPTALAQMLQSMCGQRRKKQLPKADPVQTTHRSRDDLMSDPTVTRVRPGSRGRIGTARPDVRRH